MRMYHSQVMHYFSIVPKTYPSLGRWVGQQREQYKKLQEGKASPMTPERIALLEKIDFCWNAQVSFIIRVGLPIVQQRNTPNTQTRMLSGDNDLKS